MKVDVVELDPSILQVAQETFGFVQDDRLKVIIEDGLLFVKRNALSPSEPNSDSSPSSSSSSSSVEREVKKYHYLIIDVDSKDTTVGMSCPPEAFVEQAFLEEVKCLLMPEAMLLLNLVCRSDQIYQRVMAIIRSVFGSDVVVFQWKDDVNRIVAVFHREHKIDGDALPVEIPQRALSGVPLKKQITSLDSVVSLPFDPALELADLLDDLDISAPFRPKESAPKAAAKPKGSSGGGGGGNGGKHKRGKGKPKRKY